MHPEGVSVHTGAVLHDGLVQQPLVDGSGSSREELLLLPRVHAVEVGGGEHDAVRLLEEIQG